MTRSSDTTGRLVLLGLAACAVILGFLHAAPAPALAPAAAPKPALPSEAAMMTHLNAVLAWYHQAQASSNWVTQSADEYHRDTQRDLTRKVIAGAFNYARAAELVTADQAPVNAKIGNDERQGRLTARLAANRDRLDQLRAQQAELKGRLATAAPPDRALLESRAHVLEAEADLAATVDDTLKKAVNLSADSSDPSGLESRVAALERTVPEAFDAPAPAATPAAAPAKPVPAPSANPGLLSRTGTLFSLLRNERAIDALIAKTHALQIAAKQLADPIRTELRAVMPPETPPGADAQLTDPAQLEAARQKLENLTARFRHLADALLPLREEAVALDQTEANLGDWKRSVRSQADDITRYLLVHAIALAIALGVVLIISEIWRRATFRYIHDARRRRHLLVVRRFAMGILLTVVIFTGFLSDFSSLATFAGFITAGIAVALQTIVLSVAAYFFLIGRYGVKVGDRVTVAGVTGDVIDIGLVRVFLMELAGTGVDLHPTGRVVVLANSALFSATLPVYKQLPGTDYAWHELYVTLAVNADTKQTEELLLHAVNEVYGGYRGSIEQQHGALERLVDYKTEVPVPSAHVRLTDTALEVVIRYPAEIRRMAETDETVTRAVLAALRQAGDLAKSFLAMPRIRAAVKS